MRRGKEKEARVGSREALAELEADSYLRKEDLGLLGAQTRDPIQPQPVPEKSLLSL